jgi:hypothetical protein
MPTARELLEQADALMRRNRGGGDGGDVPMLTESVPEALDEPVHRGPATRERVEATLRAASPELRSTAERDGAASAADLSADADLPVLTDVVEELAVDIVPLSVGKAEEDSAPWLGPDTIDPALHSITGPLPDTLGVVPPMTLRAVPSEPTPAALEAELDESVTSRTLRAAGSAATPPPVGSMPAEDVLADFVPAEAAPTPEVGDAERWRALSEQISMQVLQRLDLFVDTGLKAQLAAHLQPIVARAGAELVEAINDHVGHLVRSYVAEAVEREIAQWRQGSGSGGSPG